LPGENEENQKENSKDSHELRNDKEKKNHFSIQSVREILPSRRKVVYKRPLISPQTSKISRPFPSFDEKRAPHLPLMAI
jgi:hypothetical protein